MVKKVFDNFTGEGLEKAQDYILKNLEKNLSTKNLNVIKANSHLHEFEISFKKLISTNRNVICILDRYEGISKYKQWIINNFNICFF
jgi:hypothetical protein